MAVTTGGGKVVRWCDRCEREHCPHKTTCPSCGEQIYQYEPAARGPTPDDSWVCLWCPAVVCIWCYVPHTQEHKTDGNW